jgi:hypothetical protein
MGQQCHRHSARRLLTGARPAVDLRDRIAVSARHRPLGVPSRGTIKGLPRGTRPVISFFWPDPVALVRRKVGWRSGHAYRRLGQVLATCGRLRGRHRCRLGLGGRRGALSRQGRSRTSDSSSRSGFGPVRTCRFDPSRTICVGIEIYHLSAGRFL